MKIVCVGVLVMVIPLIGGCTASDTIDDGPTMGWWHDSRIQPGPPGCPPTTIIRYYVPDSIHPTLLAVKRTLQEIDVKMKDVKKALDVASKKVPTSGDSDIGRALGEIDSKIREVRTSLDITSRRVPISGDIVQIISYLRPKLNVEVDPNVLCSDKKIRMIFNITNRGEHSVSIGGIQLTLSTGKDATTGESPPDMDYRESGGFYVAPGQTIKRIVDIEIREAEFKGRPLYYSICIDTETEPEIVELLSVLLLNSLETDKLYSISRASFKLAGEISPSAFRHPEGIKGGN